MATRRLRLRSSRPTAESWLPGMPTCMTRRTLRLVQDWAVMRLNPNGSLDKTFGGTGYVTTRLTPEIWMGQNSPESIVLGA